MILSSKDKKNIVSIILSRAPGSGLNEKLKRENESAFESKDEGMDFMGALTEAAGSFIDAVKGGDAKIAAKAFHEMFKACEMAPHEEYDEEE